MTPAEQSTEKRESPFSIRRRECGGKTFLQVSSSMSAMDALRARIRAQSKSVAEHIASHPDAKAFIDDWAAPETPSC